MTQAKDCFREFYTQHLAKRLLLARSASLDAEKASISRLKKLCGPAYTAKLEGMVTDLGVGQGIEQVWVWGGGVRLNSTVDFVLRVVVCAAWRVFFWERGATACGARCTRTRAACAQRRLRARRPSTLARLCSRRACGRTSSCARR